MPVIFAKNTDKCLEVGDTSASKKLQKFVVAVTWLCNVPKVIFLCPRDTLNLRIGKLTDKVNISFDAIQKFSTIDRQLAHAGLVQRTDITELC